uniref:Uncharacterized protein n=1 Tax=Sphaerodactylus townsendi TaxID=933632 RepID=A0ACB8F988_9SAUR
MKERGSPSPRSGRRAQADERAATSHHAEPVAPLTCAAKPQVADDAHQQQQQDDPAAGSASPAPWRRHRCVREGAGSAPPRLLFFSPEQPLQRSSFGTRSPPDFPPGSRPPPALPARLGENAGLCRSKEAKREAGSSPPVPGCLLPPPRSENFEDEGNLESL